MPGDHDPGLSGAETVTVSFPSGGLKPTLVESGTDPGGPARRGPDKRRLAVFGGSAAVVAVGIVAVVVATGGGGSGAAAGKTDRQDSQIGSVGDAAGTRSGDPLGGPAPGQGNGAGGRAQGTTGDPAGAQGTATGPGGSTGSATGAGPTGATGPTGPGAPSGPGHVTTSAPGATTPPGGSQQPSSAPAGGQPSASGNPPPAAAARPLAYGGRLGATETSSTAATSLTVQASSGSSDGDTLLLSVMLTNTRSGGVGATDSAGNSYSVIADQSDGAGDRTLILGAVNAKALRSGGTVTLTFPATAERHAALDAFHGVTKVTGHSSATAASGSFASGAAPAASASSIVFGAAGVQGGSTVAWSSALTALPTLVVAPSDQLATAYAVVGSGSYQASGSCDHQWMADVVTLA